MSMLHCGSFHESPNCCYSCHDDDNDISCDFGLMEVEDGDVVIGRVCCVVMNDLIEVGILSKTGDVPDGTEKT